MLENVANDYSETKKDTDNFARKHVSPKPPISNLHYTFFW